MYKYAHMFCHCKSLITLNVINFDTSKVANMFVIFLGYENLSNLDVSRWDTSNVKSMESMFFNCSPQNILKGHDLSEVSENPVYKNIYLNIFNLPL